MEVKETLALDNGSNLQLKTSNWAKQAHGAVVYQCDDLVILATVCATKDAVEGQDFFPLTVDYREKFYASGIIPGSYFKRETRPSEHETLMSRLIDRPCRPLFPKGYLCEVQLLVTVLSHDPNVATEGHAISAASAALSVSDIPWSGPIAGVLLGRVNGEVICDPSHAQRKEGDLELLVAGSADAILMIEGAGKEISDDEMIELLDIAHGHIKKRLAIQDNLAKKINKPKREVNLNLPADELVVEIREFAYDKLNTANQTKGKAEREAAIKQVSDETIAHFTKKLQDAGEKDKAIDKVVRHVKNQLHEFEFHVVRDFLFEKNLRSDHRKPDEIRDISIELNVLPSAHGSAVFTRGQTQALAVVTLGKVTDKQRNDTLDGMEERNFMLHYNFPPFSVGEVRRNMGPGRREIGHGNLAFRAFKYLFPTEKEFPYVVRVVSEILESNGSSSMATVCGTSLAMQSCGIPLKNAVSGIAMGMMSNDKGDEIILSDIAGIEDHFGDMDFKLAGTKNGITAIQLDLKLNGISIPTLKRALKQAEEGRLHILGKMDEACPAVNKDLPANAPRIDQFSIQVEKIGELIGPGGKMIRSIMEKTGADVSVDDLGLVSITSNSPDANKKAQEQIKNLFLEVRADEKYSGVIKKIMDFGAFVEILPGKQGLLHISKMSNDRVESVTDLFSEGDEVPVVVLGIDKMGRIDLKHQDVTVDKSSGRSGGRGGGGGGERSFRSNDRGGGGGGERSFRGSDRSGGGGERSFRGSDRSGGGGRGRDDRGGRGGGGRGRDDRGSGRGRDDRDSKRSFSRSDGMRSSGDWQR